jgi:hypothetical protein
MTTSATEARMRAKALSRWEGEGGALGNAPAGHFLESENTG